MRKKYTICVYDDAHFYKTCKISPEDLLTKFKSEPDKVDQIKQTIFGMTQGSGRYGVMNLKRMQVILREKI